MSHFNDEAANWDDEGKVKMMKLLASQAMKVLKPQNDISIMDFGCGTGLFGLEFTDHAKSLLGIDTSEGMLEVFDKKTQGHDNFTSKNIDLESENLDQKFDLIVSSMAFHHLTNPYDVLVKFKSMINEGGKIAIVDLDKEDGSFHPDNEGMGVKHFGFSKQELESWASDAQLKMEHHFINEIEKNDNNYKQFLAVYSV